jgi:hypothetical protein
LLFFLDYGIIGARSFWAWTAAFLGKVFEAGGEKVFGSLALEVYFRTDMEIFHTYTHIYVLCETFKKFQVHA